MMPTRQNMFSNLTNFDKFEPRTPRKIHYINRTTSNDTITQLINLATQTKTFIIQTKCDHQYKDPQLIQVLFAYKFKLHIILIDTGFLPWNGYEFYPHVQSLFSIILSPSNEIQSWGNIKMQLEIFLCRNLFEPHQLEQIHAIDIQDKFLKWSQDNFINIQQKYSSLGDWTLQMAVGMLFHQHLDTALSKSCDWQVGLFLHYNYDYVEEMVLRDIISGNFQEEVDYRSVQHDYAINQCIAIKKISALLQNSWTRKNAEDYLKTYYQNSKNVYKYRIFVRLIDQST